MSRCNRCLLQRGLVDAKDTFIFQDSRINMKALVSSALLRCSALHMAANWRCGQVRFPFLYLAVTFLICLLAS